MAKEGDGADTIEIAPVEKLVKYQVHPLATMSPPVDADKRNAMKASIKREGVRDNAVLWKTPRGNVVLIDGRTRQEIVIELREKDGVTHADNGEVIQLHVVQLPDDTTEAEALALVVRSSLLRKSPTPGQLAVAAVSYHQEQYRIAKAAGEYRKGYGPWNWLPAARDEDGKYPEFSQNQVVDHLKDTYGVNRLYVLYCCNISADSVHGTGLLDQVMSGAITVKEAKKKYDNRKDGKADDAEMEAGEQGEQSQRPVKPTRDTLRDGRGVKPPDNIAPVFLAASQLDDAQWAVGKLIQKLRTVSGLPAGMNLDAAHARKMLDGVSKLIRGSRPHAVCPECKGKGLIDEKECPRCGGAGWLCYRVYRQVAVRFGWEKEGKPVKVTKKKKVDTAEPAEAEPTASA